MVVCLYDVLVNCPGCTLPNYSLLMFGHVWLSNARSFETNGAPSVEES